MTRIVGRTAGFGRAGAMMGDAVVAALSALVPGEVVRRELVRPGDRRLRWIEAGAPDKPIVILVHGAGDIALDWAVTLPDLAALRRSHELAEQTVAAFPRGEHLPVPDSGHYIHKDQPAAVVAAITGLVDQ